VYSPLCKIGRRYFSVLFDFPSMLVVSNRSRVTVRNRSASPRCLDSRGGSPGHTLMRPAHSEDRNPGFPERAMQDNGHTDPVPALGLN